MKVLFFADTHGSQKAMQEIKKKVEKKKPELLVCAGDVSIFAKNLDLLLSKLNKLGVPVLIIPGNHELDSELKQSASLFKNIINIHKKAHKVENYVFLGFGGGGFALRDSGFVNWSKQILKKIKKDDKVILVLHGPPHGTKLDKLIDSYCGNKDYTNFIRKNKLTIAVCGHIHENFDKEDVLNGTKIINPGPYGKVINL